MRILLGFAMLALSACSSASIGFMGVSPVTVVVEGWTIDVYAKDGKAEAIRLTTDWDQTAALMRERGIVAVETATGWVVDRRTVTGDGSVVRMRRRQKS
jgi:hypothetical protein